MLFAYGLTEDSIIYEAGGCELCRFGYKKRVAVFEFLPITETISSMIIEHCDVSIIEKEMHKIGISNLRAAAIDKVKNGITSLDEINRVII